VDGGEDEGEGAKCGGAKVTVHGQFHEECRSKGRRAREAESQRRRILAKIGKKRGKGKK
jgi:hypothetical protein